MAAVSRFDVKNGAAGLCQSVVANHRKHHALTRTAKRRREKRLRKDGVGRQRREGRERRQMVTTQKKSSRPKLPRTKRSLKSVNKLADFDVYLQTYLSGGERQRPNLPAVCDSVER
jgi:hypothetical protein